MRTDFFVMGVPLVSIMEYYSAIKKEQNFAMGSNMGRLEGIMLSEINQRKTATLWYHLYMESKK